MRHQTAAFCHETIFSRHRAQSSSGFGDFADVWLAISLWHPQCPSFVVVPSCTHCCLPCTPLLAFAHDPTHSLIVHFDTVLLAIWLVRLEMDLAAGNISGENWDFIWDLL
jgi:hypothetical protein